MITREKWVSNTKASGLSEEAMHRWHAEFEDAVPKEYREFLEFLHIPVAEIGTISAFIVLYALFGSGSAGLAIGARTNRRHEPTRQVRTFA